MHLWDFKRAGIQIWDFWMPKMSDTGKHNESYLIPNSVESVIAKPTEPGVILQIANLQAVCERCVYFAVQRIFPRRVCTCVATGNWKLYVHLYSVYYTKNPNMSENWLVCRYRILSMQILNFRYANMDFFKTPHIQIRQGVVWIQKKCATGQKINTETNIDRKLTKITRHGLYPSQIQVWTFLGPNPTPIMVKIDYVC